VSRYTRRNLVPGHYRGVKKKGKTVQVKNPGYDVKELNDPQPRNYYWIWRGRQNAIDSASRWYKPFKSKPVKRREKRGQSKPR